MWATIAGIVTILAAILKLYIETKKKKKAISEYEKNKQDLDNALADNDTDELTRMFDEFTAPPGYSSNTGKQGHQETTKRQL